MDGVCDAVMHAGGHQLPGCGSTWASVCDVGICVYHIYRCIKIRIQRRIAGIHDPKALLCMLVMIHVVIPAVACGAGHLFFGSDPYAITGMVLEFSVPTAVVGLMWVTIYNGNNPLSLSLVVIDTILSPFLIPLTLRVLVGSQVEIDATMMMRQLIFMVALPAIAAMVLNQ